uniref:Glycoprotein n=1 Tax=Hodotermopsis sjostedti phenuivirus 3 TaxID=3133461 RepID=A0AAT9JNH8_9VIRU
MYSNYYGIIYILVLSGLYNCVGALSVCTKDISCNSKKPIAAWTGTNADQTCYKDVHCGTGFFLDEKCHCSIPVTHVYPKASNGSLCQYGASLPKTNEFFRSVSQVPKCDISDADEHLVSNHWCHVSDTPALPPGACSVESHDVEVTTILFEGIKLDLLSSRLRHVQIGKIEDSVIVIGNDCGEGDVAYSRDLCRMNHNDPHCSLSANNTRCYGFRDRGNEILAIDLGHCLLPIDCFWKRTMKAYNQLPGEKSDLCSDCWAHCGVDEIVVNTGTSKFHMIEVCNSNRCYRKLVESAQTFFERSFQDKVADERIDAKIYGEQGELFERVAVCSRMDTCQAIDCVICWQFTFNIRCWKAGTWFSMVFITWILICGIGFTLKALKPIFKFIYGFSKVMIKTTLFGFRIGRTVTKSVIGKVSQKRVEITDAEVEMGFDRVKLKQGGSVIFGKKRDKAIKKVGPSSVITLVILIVVLFGKVCKAHDNNQEEAKLEKNGCMSYGSANYKTEECVNRHGQVVCKGGITTVLNLLGKDITSCLEYRTKDGQLIGTLRVTPHLVGLKCNKQLEYYTREHKMAYNSVFNCPHAGTCVGDWCEKFNNNVTLPGLKPTSSNLGPSNQACYRGQACAGAGCFYCTQSCVSVNWHALYLDKVSWAVYSCPSWVPKAVLFIEFVDRTTEQQRMFSWINGASITVFGKLKIRPVIHIEQKIPALSKSIIMSDQLAALIDSSPPGQPQAGMIGQLQCNEVADTKGGCILAPTTCSCSANDISGACECSEVSIKSAISKTTRLPQETLFGTLKLMRDDIFLDVSAEGHMHLEITSDGEMVAIEDSQTDCKLSIKKISGCYSCLQGAHIEYTCVSSTFQSSIMTCNLGVFPITCSDAVKPRITLAALSSPLVDLSCVASCSSKEEEVTQSGVLDYHGFDKISKFDNVRLLTNVSESGASWDWSGFASIGSFFSGLFGSLGWIKTIIILVSGMIILLLCVKCFSYISMPISGLVSLKKKV